MSRPTLYLDLDGTLLDPKKRLFTLLQELVPKNPLSEKAYWQLKREGMGQKEFLTEYCDYSADEVLAFQKVWLLQVEEPHRLQQDQLFPGIIETLDTLAKDYRLVLITNRQSKLGVVVQLTGLGLRDVFDEVMVTEQASSKSELIQAHDSPRQGDIIVGDTPEDAITGQEIGINAILVRSGVFGRTVLEETKADIILKDINELPEYLAKHSLEPAA